MAAAKGKKPVSRKKAETKVKETPKETLDAKVEEASVVVEEAPPPLETAQEAVEVAQPIVEEKAEPVATPSPKKEEIAPVLAPAPQQEPSVKTLKIGATVILPSGREAVVSADVDKKGRLLVVRKDNTRKSYLYLPEQLKLV